MSQQPKNRRPKRKLTIAVSCLGLWLLLAVAMSFMLNFNGGIDGMMLNQPILFFATLAASVFLLATGLNNLISYFKKE